MSFTSSLAFFDQRAAERPYEDTLVADATMHDLDLDVLSSYRKALIDANPATDVRDLELGELVQALGGARLEAGTLRPTVAGVLLFGRQLALRRLFPFFRVDYIRIQGTEWVENTERRFETLDVRQPLLVAFRRIYQAILDELPRSVELRAGSPERVESPTVPERVIREALVNALCHRDYRVQSPIQVIRYTNRIEFRNAGHSLVDEEALGEPGSESRNPRIADVFRAMRLAENKGSGVRVMRREMENAKLALPLFDSDRENNRFIATLLFTHLLGDEQRAWLTSLNTVALSREEELALVYCREEAPIRNASLRDLTGLDTLAASAVLRGLRDKGLLVAVGAGAQTHYILSTAAAAASQTTLSPEPPAAPMEPGVRGQGVLFPDLPPTPLRSQAGPDAGGSARMRGGSARMRGGSARMRGGSARMRGARAPAGSRETGGRTFAQSAGADPASAHPQAHAPWNSSSTSTAERSWARATFARARALSGGNRRCRAWRLPASDRPAFARSRWRVRGQ